MSKTFRKRDNTASLTEEMLNITNEDTNEDNTEEVEETEVEQNQKDVNFASLGLAGLFDDIKEKHQMIQEMNEESKKLNEISSEISSKLEQRLKNAKAKEKTEPAETIRITNGNVNINDLSQILTGEPFNLNLLDPKSFNEEPKQEQEYVPFFVGDDESLEEEPLKQAIYFGYHDRDIKNKRLQLLINDEVLEDLRQEAKEHDISVNELVNRLIKHFLYD